MPPPSTRGLGSCSTGACATPAARSPPSPPPKAPPPEGLPALGLGGPPHLLHPLASRDLPPLHPAATPARRPPPPTPGGPPRQGPTMPGLTNPLHPPNAGAPPLPGPAARGPARSHRSTLGASPARRLQRLGYLWPTLRPRSSCGGRSWLAQRRWRWHGAAAPQAPPPGLWEGPGRALLPRPPPQTCLAASCIGLTALGSTGVM